MVGKRILFFVMILMLLVAVGVGGYYFYISYFPKKVTSLSTDNSTSVTTAVLIGIQNGGNSIYPQTVGGLDDFNNGSTLPVDSYYKTWIACNAGNNYCGTSDPKAEKQDPNTGAIWSGLLVKSTDWFTANNCKYPNGLAGDDGVCDTHDEVACRCVKYTGGNGPLLSCAAFGDGKWRLPYQKELMQAYIDGSWANLTDANNGFWSGTTRSDSNQTAWAVYLSHGNASRNDKTVVYSVRCVR